MATPSTEAATPPRRKAGRPRNADKPQIEAAKAKWLDSFTSLGWQGACDAAGVATSTPYEWFDRDMNFRKAHQRRRAGVAAGLAQRLDDIAHGRVTVENGAPVTAAIFRLKALAPKMYRENTRVELTGKNGKPIEISGGDSQRGVQIAAQYLQVVAPQQITDAVSK